MRKVLFVTVALLAIVFFVSTPLTSAQKKIKSVSVRTYIPYIEREAEEQAHDLWSSRLTRCGNDYYARDGDEVYQFRNSRITVSPNSLTRADRRNGTGYSGYTYFKVGQTRVFSRRARHYQNAGWGSWYDGLRTQRGSFSLTMALHKDIGHWSADPLSSQMNNLKPVDCREIYRYRDGFYGRNDDYYVRDDYYIGSRDDNIRDDDSIRDNNPDRPDDNPSNRERRINWIRLNSEESVPSNAVIGGAELSGDTSGITLYVCRVTYNGDWQPGKLLDGSCSIGFGGREIAFSTYEVATGSGSWRKPPADYSGAFTGGREAGRTFHICRANLRELVGSGSINYGQYPGRIVDGRCNFAFGEKGLTSSDFEVFYLSSDNDYRY